MSNIMSIFDSIFSMFTMEAFWKGALTTIILFVSTLCIALPLGLPFALGSNSKILPIRWICKFYIWVMRGTPLMLQLFFFYYYVYAELNGRFDFIKNAPHKTNMLIVAIVTFALNYAAYFAEIYRGGIASINKGQYEAAQSLGISRSRTLFGIVLPQTFKAVLPPIFNETITLVKDTALASVIAIEELMKFTKTEVNGQGKAELYIPAALFYLAFTVLVTLFSKYLEKKVSLQVDEQKKVHLKFHRKGEHQ